MGSSYSHISSETDVGKELEQDDTQPEKRQRIVDEQSMVVYGQQGSSSNSQLTSQSVTLYNNSAEYQRMILTEKLNRLFARRDDVVRELENAEIQPGKKRRAEVQHWLTEVGRKEQKIQTMIQDGQRSTCNSKIALHIESFIKEVDELVQRGEFSKGLVLLDQESTRLPLLLDIKPAGTNFQQNTEKILGWLQNHEHCIIGVYGMGGVGKTTLLMHIHDQLLQDSNLSGHVYWVTVSQNCPVRKLQDDIAKVLGLASFQEDDERKRAAVLHKRLAARGRTVLILDDMWEHVSGSKVGIPLEKSNCKIILSTRSYDICRRMGCKNFVVKAETLDEGEAWDLFVEKLGHYDILEEEAKKIAVEIAKECGGLPLAIATMARSMTDVVDIHEWKDALNELKSGRGQPDMKEDVFRILRYSYDRLNDNKRVQECFLSCILYGEDAAILRTDLIDLWIYEGLLDEIESKDAQEAKGHVILNKLESSCLLESLYDRTYVKMHDLIRDMVIIITKEHPVFIAEARKQLKQVPKQEKWSKDLVKVSLIDNEIEEIPSGMAPMTPNLTVLMLDDNPLKIIPDSFFVHMRSLTVLNLSHTHIERVPESVSDLENLRGLLLSDCEQLEYVPSVAKLTKLRTLDLECCFKLKEAPSGLERLKCAETLSYIPWDVSNVIGFNELIQSLPSLIRYRFFIQDSAWYFAFDEWGIFYEYEKVVRIRGGEFGVDKSRLLVPNTFQLLDIGECDMKGSCLGDVIQSVTKESVATGVKKLRIEDCGGLESISGTKEGSPILWGTSQLKVFNLPDLRSIAKPGVPHFFSHLRNLEILWCRKLKVVVPMTCTDQLHLPNLESIEVEECEEVEEIFETNKPTLSNFLVLLPKLEQVRLWGLPKLKVIFPTAEQLQLPCLRSIKVIYCKEVEEIFGSNTAIIPNLKKLELDELHKLKVIFPTAEKLHLPNLESIYVSGCKDLREIFGLNKASLSSHILSFSLNKVTTIFLIDLPKIKVIFPFIEELHLPNLKYITVRRCEEVVEVFETNKTILSSFEPNKTILSSPILSRSLPNLLELELEDLPKIKVILPFIEELHLPNLEIITVRRCEEVVEVFETNKAPPYKPNLSLPKLQDLYLVDLPKLGSIYRGLLFCPNLVIRPESISDCPKLTLWRLPGAVTSTEPWSPMESHYIRSFNQQPACLPHSDAPLSMMESHYIRSFNQQETLLLTDQINSTNQPASLHHSDDDTDDDDTQWGASLSL